MYKLIYANDIVMIVANWIKVERDFGITSVGKLDEKFGYEYILLEYTSTKMLKEYIHLLIDRDFQLSMWDLTDWLQTKRKIKISNL